MTTKPRKPLLSLDDALALDREQVVNLYSRHVNSVLAQTAAPFGLLRNYVKAEGTFLWDDSGRRYYDFFNGFGCLNLGHNHPRVVGALRRALDRSLPMIHQLSPSAVMVALAHNLSALLPEDLSVSYFMNSGSEAVEAAIKMARIATGRKRFLAAHNSYHGRTLGALTLTGMEQYRAPFEPLAAGVEHVAYNDIAALRARLACGEFAALFLEPIQGQGGVRVPDPDYLPQARELCNRYGTLLVFDEVQTGFGRTGDTFAFEFSNTVPDILLTSKSFGGGVMPLSACTTSPEIWTKAYGTLKKFVLHSSTFSGNTLACVAGMAAIEALINEHVIENCREQSEYFFARLRQLKEKYPVIKEIRGRGLMIGLVFDLANWNPLGPPSRAIIDAISPKIVTAFIAARFLNDHGIIVPPSLTDEYLLRIYPPLTVRRENIDYFIAALEQVCASLGGYQNLLQKTLPKLIRYRVGAVSAAR